MPHINEDGQNLSKHQKMFKTWISKSQELSKEDVSFGVIAEEIQTKLTKDCVDSQIHDSEIARSQIADGVQKINKQLIEQQKHADYCISQKVERTTAKVRKIQQKIKNHKQQIRELRVQKCAKEVKLQLLLKKQNDSKELLQKMKEDCENTFTSDNRQERTITYRNEFKKLLNSQTQIQLQKYDLDELANKLKEKQGLVKEIGTLNQCLKSEITQPVTTRDNPLCAICVKQLNEKDADFVITQMCSVIDKNSCQIERLLQFNNDLIKQVTELQKVTIIRLGELDNMKSWPCVHIFVAAVFAFCTYKAIVTWLDHH